MSRFCVPATQSSPDNGLVQVGFAINSPKMPLNFTRVTAYHQLVDDGVQWLPIPKVTTPRVTSVGAGRGLEPVPADRLWCAIATARRLRLYPSETVKGRAEDPPPASSCLTCRAFFLPHRPQRHKGQLPLGSPSPATATPMLAVDFLPSYTLLTAAWAPLALRLWALCYGSRIHFTNRDYQCTRTGLCHPAAALSYASLR